MKKYIKKLKSILKEVTRLDRTPKDMALSFSIGIFIAISPYIGLHTYIAIFLATFFKLPIYPVLLGSYVNNPITIAFIYTTATRLGIWLLHMQPHVNMDWSHITVRNLVKAGEELLIPFLLGTHIMAAISAIAAFPVSYAIFYLYKLKKDGKSEDKK